jgi:hypothetical protein
MTSEIAPGTESDALMLSDHIHLWQHAAADINKNGGAVLVKRCPRTEASAQTNWL